MSTNEIISKIESKLGESIISTNNSLSYQYKNEDRQIENNK